MAEPKVVIQYDKHARQQKQRIRQFDEGKAAQVSGIDGVADDDEDGQERREPVNEGESNLDDNDSIYEAGK